MMGMKWLLIFGLLLAMSISFAIAIQTIYILPSNPRISENLTCYIKINTTDATANVSISWVLNGVNASTLHTTANITNNTLTSASIIAFQNLSEGQNWSCSADIRDSGGSSALYNATNVTTLYVFHPDITYFRTNASVTTTSTAYTTVGQFNFTPPFNSTQPTVYFIYSTLTARAVTGSPNANYRTLVDGVVIDETTRSVGANGIGSVALETGNFTLYNGVHNITLQHARTVSGTLASENLTMLVMGMRDIDNNLTINQTTSSFNNTTASTAFVKLNSFAFQTSYNSSLVIMSEYNINNTGTAGLAIYRTRILMANGTEQNCSTVYRWMTAGGVGSVGSFCAIFPDTQLGTHTIEMWGQVEAGVVANFTGVVNAFSYVGESIHNLNKTDLGGKTITTTNAQVANTSIKIVTNPTPSHNIDVLVSISGNASATSNMAYQIILYNNSGQTEVARSLYNMRRFGTSGQPGVAIKVASFENLSNGSYTAALWANTTAGTISILDGRIVAMVSDATPAVGYTLPPNQVVFYSPLNTTYNNTNLLLINYSNATTPSGLTVTGFDAYLYNATTNTSIVLMANNITELNFSYNVSAYYGPVFVQVIAWQSDNQFSQTNSSYYSLLNAAPISTAIIYPPNNSHFGPAQCSQLVSVQTNDTYGAVVRTISCRLYIWNGWANTTYILNQTLNASGGNASVNFTIPQSSPQFFAVNCTTTVNVTSSETGTIFFENTGNGPAFCNTNGTPNNSTLAATIIILIIVCIFGSGYFVFSAAIPQNLQKFEFVLAAKLIYIFLLLFTISVFGISLDSGLPVFEWLTNISLLGVVGSAIFLLISLYRVAMEWIKGNWGM